MFRTMTRAAALATALALPLAAAAQEGDTSPNGVVTLYPDGMFPPTGTWNLATRAGDFVYVAGMRGIVPETNTLAEGNEARVRQAFVNMQTIAASQGATLQDAVRIVVYVTDMYRYRPIVNQIQEELWAAPV